MSDYEEYVVDQQVELQLEEERIERDNKLFLLKQIIKEAKAQILEKKPALDIIANMVVAR